VDGSPIALAAAVQAPRERTVVGESTRLDMARVTLGLDVAIETVEMERLVADVWRVDGREIRVDPVWLPVFADGRTWPLELQSGR
jgi:hypothetical protein